LLSLQFSQNLLKENKAFELHLTNEEDLDGLPESARQMAAHTAQEQNKKYEELISLWVKTLAKELYHVDL